MGKINIVYLACMYDQDVFFRVFSGPKKPIQAANKYHTLMCEGLVMNGKDLHTICSIPVNRLFSDKKVLLIQNSEYRGVKYSYLPVINISGIKHVVLFVSAFLKMISKKKNTVLVFDGLVISPAYGAVLAAKLKGIKTIALLTDLPEYLSLNNTMGKYLNNHLIKKCDGYIFLTKQMNNRVNVAKKPYIVMEGHVDYLMEDRKKQWIKGDKKIVMYAGGLEKQYGLSELCKAFIEVHKQNEELHIYGDGSFRNELENICTKHSEIKYFGVLPVEQIVEKELQATLLVNPRSPEGEFTKYSFPSKTMEYMVTGTPVAMCKLPGMPEEYKQYLYLFKSGKSLDIGEGLRFVLDQSQEALEKKGTEARDFVLRNKTNIQQAKKVSEFLENL